MKQKKEGGDGIPRSTTKSKMRLKNDKAFDGAMKKHPVRITTKIYRKYAYVSMDTLPTNYNLSKEGEERLWAYLREIRAYIKPGSIYGAGRTYTSVTVRKEIAPQVEHTFLKMFEKHKREITIEGIVDAAIRGVLYEP